MNLNSSLLLLVCSMTTHLFHLFPLFIYFWVSLNLLSPKYKLFCFFLFPIFLQLCYFSLLSLLARLLLMAGLSVSCSSVLLKLGNTLIPVVGICFCYRRLCLLCNLVFFIYPISVLTAPVLSPPFCHSLIILETCHANSCLCTFGHDFLSHPSGNFSFCPPSPCPSSNVRLWGFLMSPSETCF